jgi:hypothetical protein
MFLMYSKVNGEVVNQGEFAKPSDLIEAAFVIEEAARSGEDVQTEFKVWYKGLSLFFTSAEHMYKTFIPS